jgi:hypothetical protein
MKVRHKEPAGATDGKKTFTILSRDAISRREFLTGSVAGGQFGKNHLGDRNEFLPTVHGFDEFYGNLYHLNAEEEPENADYPKIMLGTCFFSG